jgi:glycogen debranching enzyme
MDEFDRSISYRLGAEPARPSPSEALPRAEVERLAPDILEYLKPRDFVTKVEVMDIRIPERPASALRELLNLAGVSRMAELGSNGPVKASCVTEDNLQVSPELRIFEAVFARDALRVSLFLADAYPHLVHATVTHLAMVQGIEDEPRREEEPGRIPHELRKPEDPIAQRMTHVSGWGWPYYGSVDATPLFLQAAVALWERQPAVLAAPVQARDGSVRPLLHYLDKAVDWVCRRLTASSLGLLEYGPPPFRGSLENQVWRDSWDAYVHADGALANHHRGVAALEAQVLTYDALLAMERLYRAEGRGGDAGKLATRAGAVRDAVDRYFWIEDDAGGFYAFGVDRDQADRPRPLAVRTSDMGHLLASHLLDGEDASMVSRRESIIRSLFSDELLCPAGLRSTSSLTARFHPGGYHLGSSWLWDTCVVANGLDRHGYHGLAQELRDRCLAVVQRFRKFPEFARGEKDDLLLSDRVVDIYSSADRRPNRFEQPPQEVQAWTVAAILDAKRRNGLRALGRSGALPGQATGHRRELEDELLNGM